MWYEACVLNKLLNENIYEYEKPRIIEKEEDIEEKFFLKLKTRDGIMEIETSPNDRIYDIKRKIDGGTGIAMSKSILYTKVILLKDNEEMDTNKFVKDYNLNEDSLLTLTKNFRLYYK